MDAESHCTAEQFTVTDRRHSVRTRTQGNRMNLKNRDVPSERQLPGGYGLLVLVLHYQVQLGGSSHASLLMCF